MKIPTEKLKTWGAIVLTVLILLSSLHGLYKFVRYGNQTPTIDLTIPSRNSSSYDK